MSTVQRDGSGKGSTGRTFLNAEASSEVKNELNIYSRKKKKRESGENLSYLRPQTLFSGYREGGVGEGRVGRKVNVHLCGLWADFGNDSRFGGVSVGWQSLQENSVQQVKGIPKSLGDNAQLSHRSLQQQTARLKGWELEGIWKTAPKQPSLSPNHLSIETTGF